jgi:hypothetical protein
MELPSNDDWMSEEEKVAVSETAKTFVDLAVSKLERKYKWEREHCLRPRRVPKYTEQKEKDSAVRLRAAMEEHVEPMIKFMVYNTKVSTQSRDLASSAATSGRPVTLVIDTPQSTAANVSEIYSDFILKTSVPGQSRAFHTNFMMKETEDRKAPKWYLEMSQQTEIPVRS